MMIALLGDDVGLWRFISQIEGDVKEPTLVLFEMSRGTFPGGVVYLSRITHHSNHGLMGGFASGALAC